MFVKISGFGWSTDIILSPDLRIPEENNTDVVLALVRWLSPHPQATVRDSQHRPMCPAPFDLNHALWEFTKLQRKRHPFARRHHTRQLHLFPGSDDSERSVAAERLAYAYYDLIELDSLDYFMNCTVVDNTESSYILETITLPF